MATTWGKPSLSMVARAAFLRSLKNSACSSALSRISCRRLVAMPLSLLSRDGQVHRQETPGLVEALLCRLPGITGVGVHGEAVAGALVARERADLAEGPHPRLHPAHVPNRCLLVPCPMQDQRTMQIGIHGPVRWVGAANLPAVHKGKVAPLGE